MLNMGEKVDEQINCRIKYMDNLKLDNEGIVTRKMNKSMVFLRIMYMLTQNIIGPSLLH